MQLFIECYPCILRQVINTAKLLDLNDKQIKSILDKTMEYLLESKQDTMPLHIVVWIYNFINEKFYNSSGNFDPYKDLKYSSNLLALKSLKKLEDIVDNSAYHLETALHTAAAGNIIDFGAREHSSIDIKHEIDNIANLNFSIYDYKKLFKKLKKAETLLYIGDNAGEIVFDKVLIREIKKEFSKIDIVFAVRDRPIINDATIEDASFVGLEEEVIVVSSGSVYPGTILDETNEKFKGLFKTADVIIAKGQGNFESLSDVKSENLFFLFRVKCDRVADIVGAKNGDLILFKKNTGF